MARAGGWFARAERVLAEVPGECVVHGYLLLPAAFRTVVEGAAGTAETLFSRAAEIGNRFGDVDLSAMALHGRGRALIRLNRVGEGVALLDEAMIAVTAGEVSSARGG